MTLDTLIIAAGAFVGLLPFLGFPNSWDTVLFFLAGVFIIGLGIAVRRKRGAEETSRRLAERKHPSTFVEHAPSARHEETIASE